MLMSGRYPPLKPFPPQKPVVPSYDEERQSARLRENISRFFNLQQYSDLVIITGDGYDGPFSIVKFANNASRKINAHKIVLACGSEAFYNFFLLGINSGLFLKNSEAGDSTTDATTTSATSTRTSMEQQVSSFGLRNKILMENGNCYSFDPFCL
jgi:hypothetical protein